MKRTVVNHKLMFYPIRLNVLDAVFIWQVNEQLKQQVFAEQDKALQLVRLETGFSRKRCLEILRGVKKLDDIPCRPGYNTIRRNLNE